MEKVKKKSFWWHDAVKFTVVIVDTIEKSEGHQFDAYCQLMDDGNIELYFKKGASILTLIHESLHAISFMCNTLGEEKITLAEAFNGEVMTYVVSDIIQRVMRMYFDLTNAKELLKDEKNN